MSTLRTPATPRTLTGLWVMALLASLLTALGVTAPAEAAGTTRTWTFTLATHADGPWGSAVVTVSRWDAASGTFVRLEDDLGHPVLGFATTDDPYVAEVEPGIYTAVVEPDTPYRTPEYLNGATSAPVSPTDPGVVTIGGSDVTSTITLRRRAVLRATVRDADGGLADGLRADLHRAGQGVRELTTFVVGGQLELDVPPGTWVLRIWDEEQEQVAHTSEAFTVADTDVALGTVTLDAVTAPPASEGSSVSGRVTVGGSPRAGVQVQLLGVVNDDPLDAHRGPMTTTAVNGTYSLNGVQPDTDHTVVARGNGVAPTYLGSTQRFTEAQTFTGATTTLADIDADPAAPLTGRLLLNGTALTGEDAQVDLYRRLPLDEDEYGYEWLDRAEVGADGSYQLHVTPGEYLLEASGQNLTTTYLGSRTTDEMRRAGAFTVTSTAPVTRDIPLAAPSNVTGTVTAGGRPLAEATATVYVWDEDAETWASYEHVPTDEDGRFDLPAPPLAQVTVRITGPGFTPLVLGGGSDLPARPDATNSRAASGTISTGTFALTPRATRLGKVAGENLAWCRQNRLPAENEVSSPAVALPFPVTISGTSYTQAYVNDNGSVSFSSPVRHFSPDDLTTATGVPMFAPFLADVDTRGEASSQVTYGVSPDGTQLCATWADVGRPGDDRLNTFQLVLTKATGAGRVAGDVDVRFNYDEITWETLPDDGGTAAGLTDGSGKAGTRVLLDGSNVEGAFPDGGSRALVSGRQGATRAGRYVFEIRNQAAALALGNLQGTAPASGVTVQACHTTSSFCTTTVAGADRTYRLAALPIGAYAVGVAPSATQVGGVTATVARGITATAGTITLGQPSVAGGLVTDQWGRPLPDATVRLHRADTATGTLVPVPDGSVLMSAGNRTNPVRTDSSGRWRWDVAPGSYRVEATATGCAVGSSRAMQVPPQRTNVAVTLTCTVAAPTPTTAPKVTGSGEVGTQLVATGATWAGPLVATGLEWLRNGTVDPAITGTTYTVKASDVGATFTVRSTGQRPALATDGGAGATTALAVTFQPVRATSTGVKAVVRPTGPVPPPVVTPNPPTPTAPTTPTDPPATPPTPPSAAPTDPPKAEPAPKAPKAPKARSKVTLKLVKKTTTAKRVKVTVKVKAGNARATGTVKLKLTAKGKKARTVKVKLKNGKAVVKLPKLKKRTWTVRATYAGSTTVAKATSKKYKLKVIAAKRR